MFGIFKRKEKTVETKKERHIVYHLVLDPGEGTIVDMFNDLHVSKNLEELKDCAVLKVCKKDKTFYACYSKNTGGFLLSDNLAETLVASYALTLQSQSDNTNEQADSKHEFEDNYEKYIESKFGKKVFDDFYELKEGFELQNVKAFAEVNNQRFELDFEKSFRWYAM